MRLYSENALHLKPIGINTGKACLTIFHKGGVTETFETFSNAAIDCISPWIVEGYQVISDADAEARCLSRHNRKEA